jgi:hypothetical protein
VLYEGQEGSQLAAKGGRLEIQGPCIVLISDTGEAWNVAWPTPGVHWDSLLGQIGIDDTIVPLGSAVALGGGAVESLDRPGPSWVAAPDECFKTPMWVASRIEIIPDR